MWEKWLKQWRAYLKATDWLSTYNHPIGPGAPGFDVGINDKIYNALTHLCGSKRQGECLPWKCCRWSRSRNTTNAPIWRIFQAETLIPEEMPWKHQTYQRDKLFSVLTYNIDTLVSKPVCTHYTLAPACIIMHSTVHRLHRVINPIQLTLLWYIFYVT